MKTCKYCVQMEVHMKERWRICVFKNGYSVCVCVVPWITLRMCRWPLLKEVEGTACSPSPEPGITEATHSTTAIWPQAGSDRALPFRNNIMFISNRKMPLVYRKTRISPRNVCPWGRRLYLQPLDCTEGWTLTLQVLATETRFEILFPESTHLSLCFPTEISIPSSQCTKEIFWLTVYSCTWWHCCTKWNRRVNGQQREAGPHPCLHELFKSPQCFNTKKVYKMSIKIHLPDSKVLHNIPS